MESHTRSVEKAEMFKCNKYKKQFYFLQFQTMSIQTF